MQNDIQVLTIKSTSERLEFWVKPDAPYELLRRELEEKLEKNAAFYKGAALPAVFFGKRFNNMQKRELGVYLRETVKLAEVVFIDEEDAPSPAEAVAEGAVPFEEPAKDASLFLMTTLRNGQRIECEGSVTIIGDVNAGAEVIAAGNVAVMGRLRGLVHAGARGNEKAVIAASVLLPQQLRIAGRIAILPKNRRPEGPEIVKIINGEIVVDSLN